MNAENKPALIQARLTQLRAKMRSNQVDFAVVPSSDPHISEYLPERWKSREWLSGFTGSMGTLVVGLREAAIFADSRYWVAAEAELAGTSVTLVKIPTGSASYHLDWLAQRCEAGQTIAVDGTVMGLAAARALQTTAQDCNVTLRTDLDLLDTVWENRPSLPLVHVYEHNALKAGQTRAEKLALIRAQMQKLGATHHFVSTLDDIAWLLNLRGQDVDYNPVFLAHALIDQTQLALFIDPRKIDPALSRLLAQDGVLVQPYERALDSLSAVPAGATVLVDPKRITLAFRQAIATGVSVIEQINPSTLAKSQKNAVQAQHIRQAMEQDGAALCEFFAWFEAALGNEPITELTINEKITAFRAQRAGFVCPSFSTIAGFNANGALPHYRALPDSFSVIEGNGLLLIDSGGQYEGGTTDITRVIPVNRVSDAMKRDYTLVLRGMINLSLARFPRGTLSPMLDAIARMPIWQAGLDFGHGTGHGVGYFLNVHEGPQSISRAIPEPSMAMEPGMITSNEPGLYREGQWGVRIENLVLNVPFIDPKEGRTFGEFLEFETLTLCPIDTRCVLVELLQPNELAWLNNYHRMVRERLTPFVSGAAKDWLELRTQALG